MDIRQIQYFSAVYEDLNFTRAAARLFISRQALKQAVQVLERKVGRLFYVEKNALVPTEMARRLYARTRVLVAEYEQVCKELDAQELGEGPSLRVGLPLSISLAYTAEQLAYMPEVSADDARDKLGVRYIVGSDASNRQMVLNGELDCSFVHVIHGDNVFDWRYMRGGKFHLYVLPGSPLANKESVTLDDVAEQPLLFWGDDCEIARQLLEVFAVRGLYPTLSHACSHLGDSLFLLRNDLLENLAVIGFVPASQEDSRFKGLLSLPIEEPDLTWGEFVYMRKDTPYRKAIERAVCCRRDELQ